MAVVQGHFLNRVMKWVFIDIVTGRPNKWQLEITVQVKKTHIIVHIRDRCLEALFFTKSMLLVGKAVKSPF